MRAAGSRCSTTHYWDADEGGLLLARPGRCREASISRTKTAHDAATPAGNGTLVGVLARLHHLTGETAYRDRAEALVKAFSGELERNFSPLSTLANNSEVLRCAVQVVVCGTRAEVGTKALLDAMFATSQPNRVLTVLGAEQCTLPLGHPAFGKGQHEGQGHGLRLRGPGLLAPGDRARCAQGRPRQRTGTGRGLRPMTAARCTIDSPVGPLTIAAEDDAITAVDFGAGGGPGPNGGVLAGSRAPAHRVFRRRPAGPFDAAGRTGGHALPPQGVGGDAGHSLRRDPELRRPSPVHLDSAPRAIGGACGANPIPLIIPCHRVVGSGGALGGFSSGAGCDTKRQLLALEGALPPQLPV